MAHFDLHDIKKQASLFIREKFKDARLALTDVSRIQLLTEEATNTDPWGPETRTMAMLSNAAFDLEEFERIVQVLHSRIDRGVSIRKKADRVLELLNLSELRKEERHRAQKISHGIQGFGSAIRREPLQDLFVNGTSEHKNKPEVLQSEEPESQSLLSDEDIKEENHAVAHNELEWKPFEKCPTIPTYLRHESGPASEESALISNTHGKHHSDFEAASSPFKKSLSSPGHFRDMAHANWQPFDDGVSKPDDDAETVPVDPNEDLLRLPPLDEEQGSVLHEGVQQQGKPAHRSVRQLLGFRRPARDPHSSITARSSSDEHDEVIIGGGIEEVTASCTDEFPGSETNKVPTLPPPPRPKFRARFHRPWKPTSLIDL